MWLRHVTRKRYAAVAFVMLAIVASLFGGVWYFAASFKDFKYYEQVKPHLKP
jgi:predicted PurR-regulated permease PerM